MKKARTEVRHYLQFKDFSREEYEHLFARTRWIKDKFKRYERYWPLEDRTLAMISRSPRRARACRSRRACTSSAARRSTCIRGTRSLGGGSRSRTPGR